MTKCQWKPAEDCERQGDLISYDTQYLVYTYQYASVFSIGGFPERRPAQVLGAGDLVVTISGYHNYLAVNGPIPVSIWRSGHYLLDSTEEKAIRLFVLPYNQHRLHIVKESGEAVEFEADSSMGWIALSFWHTLLHSTFPNLKLPLLLQCLWL